MGLHQMRQVVERREVHLAVTQAGHEGRRLGAVRHVDELSDRDRRQPCRLDAIERRRVATLLDVTEDRLAHVEEVAALPFEQGLDEARRVDLVSVLTSDDETEPLAAGEARTERFDVDLQISKRDAFFGEVHPLGTGGETTHQREVAAVLAHHLDDERPL